MVVCFLIHTVSPVNALSAGESRILYARVFGPQTGDARDYTPEQRRLMQKEKLHIVARFKWCVNGALTSLGEDGTLIFNW